jgi:hypothetical protein
VVNAAELFTGEVFTIKARKGNISSWTGSPRPACPDGFCTYKILKIIMRETGLSRDQVTKHGGASRVLDAAL